MTREKSHTEPPTKSLAPSLAPDVHIGIFAWQEIQPRLNYATTRNRKC